jgi:hypothetical protein
MHPEVPMSPWGQMAAGALLFLQWFLYRVEEASPQNLHRVVDMMLQVPASYTSSHRDP